MSQSGTRLTNGPIQLARAEHPQPEHRQAGGGFQSSQDGACF